ncbi:MAG: hypothetical protein KatS3mg077_2588 [Candidatus Binatia bacterium]|nr:MAG: hypothetical protein KatS3mg077_2588 [Candidatus Binatia bacterium]
MEDANKNRLRDVAEEILRAIEQIAHLARQKLEATRDLQQNVFANVNTFHSSAGLAELHRIRYENRIRLENLANEPAIARVLVTGENEEDKTYYICRGAALSDIPNLASYRAPVGRLAALSVGETMDIPGGETVTVKEKTMLRPYREERRWDSRDNVFVAPNLGPVTIQSLRLFLAQFAESEGEDLIAQLLAEERLQASVIQGVRRAVVTRMALRDQPILDRYQDEIFRLPLNTRVLLLGPAGTGKTTTLIRRLAQKRDPEFLDAPESALVTNIAHITSSDHRESWLMLTPTKLLKLYLKEAFAREGVPASDERVQTWDEVRHHLARHTFGLLKTAAGGGPLVLVEDLHVLSDHALQRSAEWFSDFDSWQRQSFVEDLGQAALALALVDAGEIQHFADSLSPLFCHPSPVRLEELLYDLASKAEPARELIGKLEESIAAVIQKHLWEAVKEDRGFLDALAQLTIRLEEKADHKGIEPEDVDSTQGESSDDETGPSGAPTTANPAVPGPALTPRLKAIRAYDRALRAHARAAAAGRQLSANSVAGQIVAWLDHRLPRGDDLLMLGTKLWTQAALRRLLNPLKHYIQSMPKRYQDFRRARMPQGGWYRRVDSPAARVHPLELDLQLLALLRTAQQLLQRPSIFAGIENPYWSSLRPIANEFRNQIFVDEAPDFSPVQLACIGALAHPRLRSFFACGDFNQRLTLWGARTFEQVRWFFPDLTIKRIATAYRQTKQLADLGAALVSAMGGDGVSDAPALPEHFSCEGVPPALIESASMSVQVQWLAQRIREIERFVELLPSIAIFVCAESEVTPLARSLRQQLRDYNIPVFDCVNGEAVGPDRAVRVFNAEHIKGLEFEAVFFVAVDRLYKLQPSLFDKYLYVGITRAATYLGLTCEGRLPAPMDSLRKYFVNDWESSTWRG